MDRTGPAFPNATTVLGALKVQVIPEDPKQGRVIGNIYLIGLAIDVKGNHSLLLSCEFPKLPRAEPSSPPFLQLQVFLNAEATIELIPRRPIREKPLGEVSHILEIADKNSPS
jgi:hypothetical protein